KPSPYTTLFRSSSLVKVGSSRLPDPAQLAAHPGDPGSTARDTLRACEWGGEPLYRRGQAKGCLKERAASPETSHHPATGRAAITYKERLQPRAFPESAGIKEKLAAEAAPTRDMSPSGGTCPRGRRAGLLALARACVARGAELGVGAPVQPAIRVGQLAAQRVQQLQVARHAAEGPACLPLVGRLVVAVGGVLLGEPAAG